ncbi:NAD(P)/FAD-dependent oxidoreductase [Chitinophaga lutea]|uniref:NAD(P)/FAD-dependent oxidoreductase n=1 Tax=Chitinophaga lutea TaxID=2488634 RepID=A0A3N4PKS9_9BACT|nr:NAD(P)/FAD-dependent oxidoreductase [Chitinophaga lutea]RPE09292.1 NAD(P)/FAD-dependent oxidoreductase [Chitinophaga lutea]
MQQTIDIDVAVVGGSSAGLAAALTLGRCGRKAVIFDTGRPRNKPAAHAQNLFTRDGTPPLELLRIGREQLVPYPSVSIVETAVTSAIAENGLFILHTDTGAAYRAQRVILATGVKDDLPDIPGLAALWGSKLVHCPYCHGWEIKDLPVAVFANGPMAYEFTAVLTNWHPDIILCTNGPAGLTAEQMQQLARNGITVTETPVEKVEETAGGMQISFADGTAVRRSAAYIKSGLIFNNTLAEQLGCELTEKGAVKINHVQETTVPGVFAAGDISSEGAHQVSIAIAGGHMAAGMCNNGLAKAAFEQK